MNGGLISRSTNQANNHVNSFFKLHSERVFFKGSLSSLIFALCNSLYVAKDRIFLQI